MKEELLSIGEFAKLRGVSVKSLRYYERVGALKPAYVNEESGYRYYSINQISDLDMVTTFIELGVPLKEIASTAALGYGQSELIEKGRELARERIGRAEAQLLQLDRYADEIAEIPGGRPAEGQPLPDLLRNKPKKVKEENAEPETNGWIMPSMIVEDVCTASAAPQSSRA